MAIIPAVTVTVEATGEPGWVLARAAPHLWARPVAHNLVLTLLHQRVARPERGRYWIAARDGDVVGVAFRSPPALPATLTPMPGDAVEAVAATIAGEGTDLPGLSAEAATAARFAGCWTEARGVRAVPEMGQRIYELEILDPPRGVGGRTRAAAPSERDLLVGWLRNFAEEAGGPGPDPEGTVDTKLPAGQLRVREVDGRPCSVAAHSDPVAGVSRIQAVYTPPEHRGHGYAGANVAVLAAQLQDRGHRCILYTDLGNATSNVVYRRIGFRAQLEALTYRFDGP